MTLNFKENDRARAQQNRTILCSHFEDACFMILFNILLHCHLQFPLTNACVCHVVYHFQDYTQIKNKGFEPIKCPQFLISIQIQSKSNVWMRSPWFVDANCHFHFQLNVHNKFRLVIFSHWVCVTMRIAIFLCLNFHQNHVKFKPTNKTIRNKMKWMWKIIDLIWLLCIVCFVYASVYDIVMQFIRWKWNIQPKKNRSNDETSCFVHKARVSEIVRMSKLARACPTKRWRTYIVFFSSFCVYDYLKQKWMLWKKLKIEIATVIVGWWIA